jgi:hypothetical protein
MPKSLSAFLNELALKADIKPDEKALVDLLSATELQNIQVPDTLSTVIDKNLVSIEQAKNNHPDIKPHYTSMALTAVDAEIDKILDEQGVPDNLKLVVKNERNTYKRLPLAVKKLDEAKAGKAENVNKTEKQSLQAEIERLHSEVRNYKDQVENVRKEYSEKEVAMRKEVLIDEHLGSYKTVFDDTLPREARRAAIRTLIDKKLQEKNADLVLDENGRLKLVGKSGANVFGDDNRPWDVQTLFDTTMSQNKILKVTDQRPQQEKTQNSGNNSTVIPGDTTPATGAPKKDTKLASLAQRALQDMEQADKYSLTNGLGT